MSTCSMLFFITSLLNSPGDHAAPTLHPFANADAAVQCTLPPLHFASDVPGGDEAEVMAFSGPEGSLLLADRGPFKGRTVAGLAPFHWTAPMGTQLLRLGTPIHAADSVMQAIYTGVLHGRALRMDLFVVHHHEQPVFRLRVLRPINGSAPMPILPPTDELLYPVMQAWPVQGGNPESAPVFIQVRAH